ncbi:uncharacterized protein EV154DRAFT_27430 [Mucor mucedo]|uniref:uncharacterized protein n=1 Tax=Mucor mucedo TaxID=29922 RepID=UPI00221EBD46|nr:uncharacterized protein EV154DRAFT_27430 [Mucor mucedo]KAI7884471.1 hypothetical protein EV154DRAFT_27430 [Mucor mucedo]
MAAHDHHDHSNCSHDHGEPKKNVASDEMALRKQAADKLAKSLIQLQEIANEHKKLVGKSSNEPVNKADVDLLIKEMGLTKAEAESALRANKCDIIATLTCLVKQ